MSVEVDEHTVCMVAANVCGAMGGVRTDRTGTTRKQVIHRLVESLDPTTCRVVGHGNPSRATLHRAIKRLERSGMFSSTVSNGLLALPSSLSQAFFKEHAEPARIFLVIPLADVEMRSPFNPPVLLRSRIRVMQDGGLAEGTRSSFLA
jgi:hypothetical protein